MYYILEKGKLADLGNVYKTHPDKEFATKYAKNF